MGVRGRGQLRRNANPEVLKEANEISAPAGGHGGRPERVFQKEVPANDPGEDFAEGGVAVGVSRTGDGNQRSEFGITESGEHAAGSSQNEGQHDGCLLYTSDAAD